MNRTDCSLVEQIMKILVVCQYYYPESFKVTDVCEALAADGYDVTVLTGKPNYPTGIVPEEYIGSKHDDEIINGVHVIRCYERGRGKGALNLAVNYASFYFSAMKKVKKMDRDFDLVFSYQLSPIFMALPARWYKKHRNVPMFLYCSDLWPESLKVYIKNESSSIFKWVKKVSRKVYDCCDRISTQSDVFVDYLHEVHEVPMEKLKYIPNFADEGYLTEDFTPNDNGFTNIMFMGNIGVAQDLEDVTEGFAKAVEKVAADNILDDNGMPVNLRLHIVGGGVRLDAIKELAEKLNICDKVEFYGQRPQEEMPKYYKMADACIVSLKADNKIGLTLPAKVQGYMAAGKPILGMINGSCMGVISEAQCGFCVPAGDAEGFCDSIIDFAKDKSRHSQMGNSAREYFLKNFRKDIHVKAVEEEINKCMK